MVTVCHILDIPFIYAVPSRLPVTYLEATNEVQDKNSLSLLLKEFGAPGRRQGTSW